MLTHFKKLLPLALLSFGFFSLAPLHAAEPPSEIEYQGAKLTLNGYGTRVKFFMKVYAGSLYLEASSSNAEEILNSDAPMSIRIDVLSSFLICGDNILCFAVF